MTKEELEKKAEDFATIECCSTCSIKNPYSCEEKCECWTFATEGVKFGYSKVNEKLKILLRQCYKYHLHPEVSEYPYDDVEKFFKEEGLC